MATRTTRNDASATDVTAHNWAVNLLKDLRTPLASSICHALRKSDPMVLSLGTAPTYDVSPDIARRDWLASNLLKKSLWIAGNDDATRRANCLLGWKEDERLNLLTNQRLRTRCSSTLVTGDSFIHEMSRKIAKVLGPLDLDKVFKNVGFSQGSSTRLPRRLGQPHNKIGGQPHVTPKALPYAMALVRSSPAWTEYCWDYVGVDPLSWFTIVPGGRWFTVPKNAGTDRSCEQQPDLNLILQKGVGVYFKKQLRRVGVDLRDQTRNATLALEASITDALATLDLKSASNSVAIELVRRLLPPDWFDLLDALRCEWVEIDGTWHKLAMFSSMGNGFTFELESLIFWAATSCMTAKLHPSVVDTRYSIFGDDIIVAKAAAGSLVELLNYFGFRVNESKSFVTGPFRESCGMHAYKGVDITPFYMEEDFTHKSERLRLANKLRAWSATQDICDPRYEKSYLRVAAGLDSYRGPSSDGDSVLHSPTFARKGRSWVAKTVRSQATDPDKELSGLISNLLLRWVDGDSTLNDDKSDLTALQFAKLVERESDPAWPKARSSLSIRGEGDSVTYTRTRPLSEDVTDGFTSKRKYRNWTRDISVPCWPHELTV